MWIRKKIQTMSREIGVVPTQVVVGILTHENRVLVGERPQGKPYSGYWEFPGGKIEPHETAQAALKRELHEELGIEVTKATPWFQHEHTYPDKTVLLHVWLIQEFVGTPVGKENQKLAWVTFAEMSKLRVLEGNTPIIDSIENLLLNRLTD